MNFRTLEEFWAFYMSHQSMPATRLWHFAGTVSALLSFLLALLLGSWLFILAAPVLGYLPAWCSHFVVEGNASTTFGHPYWSFLCDVKMFWLVLTWQMDRKIKRLGKACPPGLLITQNSL